MLYLTDPPRKITDHKVEKRITSALIQIRIAEDQMRAGTLTPEETSEKVIEIYLESPEIILSLEQWKEAKEHRQATENEFLMLFTKAYTLAKLKTPKEIYEKENNHVIHSNNREQ